MHTSVAARSQRDWSLSGQPRVTVAAFKLLNSFGFKTTLPFSHQEKHSTKKGNFINESIGLETEVENLIRKETAMKDKLKALSRFITWTFPCASSCKETGTSHSEIPQLCCCVFESVVTQSTQDMFTPFPNNSTFHPLWYAWCSVLTLSGLLCLVCVSNTILTHYNAHYFIFLTNMVITACMRACFYCIKLHQVQPWSRPHFFLFIFNALCTSLQQLFSSFHNFIADLLQIFIIFFW